MLRPLAVLLLILLPGCPSYDALVVRYAARENGCPEARTHITQWLDAYDWRLDVCGESMRYVSSGNGADSFARRDDDESLGESADERFGSSGPSDGASGSGSVHVRGYYRRDGTYVHSYSRRRPH